MLKRWWLPLAAGMLVTATGCAQKQIVQFHRLEQSTGMELFERGANVSDETAPRIAVSDPTAIARVVKVVNAPFGKWEKLGGEPRMTRYTIRFRTGGDVTETFWLDEGQLAMKLSENDYRTRKLAATETAIVMKAFAAPQKPDQR